jgi:hypothetical protein
MTALNRREPGGELRGLWWNEPGPRLQALVSCSETGSLAIFELDAAGSLRFVSAVDY